MPELDFNTLMDKALEQNEICFDKYSQPGVLSSFLVYIMTSLLLKKHK